MIERLKYFRLHIIIILIIVALFSLISFGYNIYDMKSELVRIVAIRYENGLMGTHEIHFYLEYLSLISDNWNYEHNTVYRLLFYFDILLFSLYGLILYYDKKWKSPNSTS